MQARTARRQDPWASSPERASLLEIYGRADSLFDGWACSCAGALGGELQGALCCHFGVTGREPYPTAIELAEVRFAIRARGITLGQSRNHGRSPQRLTQATQAMDGGRCPLLSKEDRCRIYPSRPFGCRTFFCSRAEGPYGARGDLPRGALRELGGQIAALSARFAPRDSRPRPFVRALVDSPRD
jgi:hypothetical protein